MNVKTLWKKRNVHYTMIGVGIAVIAIAGFVIYESTRIKLEFELNENVIEYGTEQESIGWLTMSTTNGNKVTATELDTKTIGVVKTKFNVCLDDTCKEFEKDVEIKDTQAPEIVFKEESIEITEGDEFDPATNVESVKDPVDGDIPFVEEATESDCYTITSDVDVDTIGDYTVKVVALDKNKQSTENEYTVHVIEKEKEEEPSTGNNSSGNKYTPQANGNGGNGNNSGGNISNNTTVEEPHYRTDISSTYVALINAYRQENGIEQLPITAEAQAEADRRAMELIAHYGHDSGMSFNENIGMGDAGYDFFQAWKNSPGHNAAMLRGSEINGIPLYSAIAVSVVEYNGKWYAVTSFKMN